MIYYGDNPQRTPVQHLRRESLPTSLISKVSFLGSIIEEKARDCGLFSRLWKYLEANIFDALLGIFITIAGVLYRHVLLTIFKELVIKQPFHGAP